jgi:radical SAM superfamily enzyme YgiQ (UPF0313 family)
MKAHKRPFIFGTEASIDLADDKELMEMMVKAGFNSVFVGIETTNEDSLVECNKVQNRDRDLLSSVKTIQASGLQVTGGFILGFDSDPPSVFDKVSDFIQNSGIVSAMVGLLNAPKNTDLYKRMMSEDRMLEDGNGSGNNTDFAMNFIPKMNYDTLVEGYKSVIAKIYGPKPYYERVKTFLRDYKPNRKNVIRFNFSHAKAFVKANVRLGVFGKERWHYWKLLIWTTFRKPSLIPLSVTLAIYGFHFRRFFEQYM